MKIERVLIHPIIDPEMSDICGVWEKWRTLPTTRIIEDKDFPGLADMRFLSNVDRYLLVGGRGGGTCVTTMLSNLAKLPEVKSQVLQVALSLEATLISPDTLSYVISKIFIEQGVLIRIER